MEKKRGDIRIKKSYTATIEILGDSDVKPVEVKGINLSEKGMMFLSSRMILPKTKLKIKLRYANFSISGVVEYSNEDIWHPKSKGYLCNIIFTSISPKARKTISSYVHNKIKKYTWRHWL